MMRARVQALAMSVTAALALSVSLPLSSWADETPPTPKEPTASASPTVTSPSQGATPTDPVATTDSSEPTPTGAHEDSPAGSETENEAQPEQNRAAAVKAPSVRVDPAVSIHGGQGIGTGWTAARTMFPGDFTGDGNTDLLLIANNGDLHLYRSLDASSFADRVRIGTGWLHTTDILSADWDRNGTIDLVGRSSNGELKFYPGDNHGNILGSRSIGTGWNRFTSIAAVQKGPGGHPAIIGLQNDGLALVYATDGNLNFKPPVRTASDWVGFRALTGTTDWDTNGRHDYITIDADNRLRYLASSSSGYDFDHREVGTGWGNHLRVTTARINNKAYVWAIDKTGNLIRYNLETTENPPAAPQPPANPGVNVDSRCLTGRVLCASKADRKLRWMVNGQVVLTLDARFGSAKDPSDDGAFRVTWKSKNHVSSIYRTPMPYAMFYNGGEAVHYSSDFAARGWQGGSHGCVNIRDKAGIAWLFDQVKVGDKVVVY